MRAVKDLLQVNNLKVHFHVAEGIIKAVEVMREFAFRLEHTNR